MSPYSFLVLALIGLMLVGARVILGRRVRGLTLAPGERRTYWCLTKGPITEGIGAAVVTSHRLLLMPLGGRMLSYNLVGGIEELCASRIPSIPAGVVLRLRAKPAEKLRLQVHFPGRLITAIQSIGIG